MEKIYLLDVRREVIDSWKESFAGCDVHIVNEDFKTFLSEHDDVDGIVSPANSFGLMDGGYDKAISEYFGDDLYSAVQNKILEEYLGEQPTGTCLAIKIPNTNKILLHTPTMRIPEIIINPSVIYSCMRSTLVEAEKNNVKQIIIPAFGGMTGCVPPEIIAMMMRAGYDDVLYRKQNKYYNTWSNIRKLW